MSPEELLARRQALGLSQRKLGELLGVPRNTVARWERGELRVARPDWLGLALANLEATPGAATRIPREPGLPDELSTFVGREREIEECCALLKTARLVTLTGAGGVGKSRLALKVASCVACSYPDGIYLVELATLRDSCLVAHSAATAMGLHEQSGQSVMDVLQEWLRSRRVLLILDNCEHMIQACSDFANDLLRCAPQLTILATSREAFRVTGERAWRVPSLTTPPPRAGADEIAQYEAVRLFVDRAQAVAPWFMQTSSNLKTIAQVCRKLDGIPLALELAAAHLRALSLDELAVRLEHRLLLLTSGSRTAPSRQLTLRAAVNWSYNTLTKPERALFRRLSVFAGGWTVEAAEVVGAGGVVPAADTLGLLERLIDKSLVVAEERNGVVRHVMLETLREYGQERLVDAGEAEQIRRRHLAWILQLAERTTDPLEPCLASVATLEREWDNLRAALHQAYVTGETAIGMRLATISGPLWNLRGRFGEGITWLKRMLSLPGAAELQGPYAQALKLMGVMLYGQGNIGAAEASIRRGCELAASSQSEEPTPPLCVDLLASIARASGDLSSAFPLYQQARAEYRKRGLRCWEAATLFYMASVLFEQGEFARSRAACTDCIALGQRREFIWATSRALIILAYLENHDGDPVAAERLAQQALGVLRTFDEPGVGIALRALAIIALGQGQVAQAWSYLAEALDISRNECDRMASARNLEAIVGVLVDSAPARAAEVAAAASVLRRSTRTLPWPSERARLTRWLERARRRIGSRAWDAAWAKGEALAPVDMVETVSRYAAHALIQVAAPKPAPGGLLTSRQREVAALVARGLTNEQIAKQLVISPSTARAHVEAILDRLALHSRAQIAAWAVQHEAPVAV